MPFCRTRASIGKRVPFKRGHRVVVVELRNRDEEYDYLQVLEDRYRFGVQEFRVEGVGLGRVV